MLAFALRRPFVAALAVYLALPPLAVVAAIAVAFVAAVVAGAALHAVAGVNDPPPWTDDLARTVGTGIRHALGAWFVQAPLPLAAAALVRRAWMYGTDRQRRADVTTGAARSRR